MKTKDDIDDKLRDRRDRDDRDKRDKDRRERSHSRDRRDPGACFSRKNYYAKEIP